MYRLSFQYIPRYLSRTFIAYVIFIIPDALLMTALISSKFENVGDNCSTRLVQRSVLNYDNTLILARGGRRMGKRG